MPQGDLGPALFGGFAVTGGARGAKAPAVGFRPPQTPLLLGEVTGAAVRVDDEAGGRAPDVDVAEDKYGVCEAGLVVE